MTDSSYFVKNISLVGVSSRYLVKDYDINVTAYINKHSFDYSVPIKKICKSFNRCAAIGFSLI